MKNKNIDMVQKTFYMGQRILPFCALCIIVFLAGCADSRYLSEKLFWQAQKNAKTITENAKGVLSEKDYARIIAGYEKVIKTCPLQKLSAQSHFVISQLYLHQGKPDAALSELRKVIQNFNSQDITSRAQFAVAALLERQNFWNRARDEYEKVVDLYPLTPLGLATPLYIISHYQRENDSVEEEKAFRSALRHYRTLVNEYRATRLAPFIHNYIAQAYLAEKDFEQAISVLDELARDYPQSSQAATSFLAKGEILSVRMKDIPGAIKVYQDFINRYPDNALVPEVQFRLAMMYFYQRDIEKAQDVLSQIIARYPDNTRARLNAYTGLSLCFQKTKDTKRLLEVYEDIQREFPETKMALAIPFLVNQYYQQNKLLEEAGKACKDAIAFYEKAFSQSVKGEGKRSDVGNYLVLCYLQDNALDKAEVVLRLLLQEYPGKPEHLLNLASFYLASNAPREAIVVYQAILDKYPRDGRLSGLVRTQIKTIQERMPK